MQQEHWPQVLFCLSPPHVDTEESSSTTCRLRHEAREGRGHGPQRALPESGDVLEGVVLARGLLEQRHQAQRRAEAGVRLGFVDDHGLDAQLLFCLARDEGTTFSQALPPSAAGPHM